MYSCAPSDNSAYDKGYDTGFNAGYEDGLKKAEEQNQQALEEAIELGYQEGKQKYLKEKREIEARKSESGKRIITPDENKKNNSEFIPLTDKEMNDLFEANLITVEIEPIELIS